MSLHYPPVMSEQDTVRALLDGRYRGLARYGDGDMNLLRGRPDRFYRWDAGLARSVAMSLVEPHHEVLQCLIPPPACATGLAAQRWIHYLEANAGILPFLRGEIYGSSNISRMDSCPHLHTISWWHEVSKLWRDKDICLVAGTDRSLTTAKLMESPHAPRKVIHVSCAGSNNFHEMAYLRDEVARADVETVVLCAGLISRPLVHRLVADGLKAYDLGHFGLWFNRGQPIPLADCPR